VDLAIRVDAYEDHASPLLDGNGDESVGIAVEPLDGDRLGQARESCLEIEIPRVQWTGHSRRAVEGVDQTRAAMRAQIQKRAKLAIVCAHDHDRWPCFVEEEAPLGLESIHVGIHACIDRGSLVGEIRASWRAEMGDQASLHRSPFVA